MTADVRGRAALVAIVAAAAAVPACKSAPKRRMEAQAPVESIDEAELALADNERRLQELGIVPPSKRSGDGFGYDGGDEESTATQSPDAVESTGPTGSTASTASTDAPALSSKTEEDASVGRSTAVVSRCTRICDIAESTCALAQQVCDLASRHPDKPRYAKACERAEQQCDVATEACETCE